MTKSRTKTIGILIPVIAAYTVMGISAYHGNLVGIVSSLTLLEVLAIRVDMIKRNQQ